MTDTERLNLIEHYKWAIQPLEEGWMITGRWGYVCGPSIRTAFDYAYKAQFKWATGGK